MKKLKQIVIAILTGTLLFSFVACGDSSKDSVDTSSGSNYEETIEKTFTFQSTIKNDEYAGTGNYLVKNNTTEYALVIPAEAQAYEIMAANEFNEFISLATGVSFDIVAEDEITYNSSEKYVLFGNTNAATTEAVKAEKSVVSANGYTIQTKKNSLFVVGASETGTLYATYDLLTALVEYRSYAVDEIRVKDGVKEIELRNYNFTYKPTIETRQAYGGMILQDVTFSHRMKNIVDTDLWAKVGGVFCHTAPKLIPGSEQANHPEWFAADGNQLCYSEGLENEEMFEYLYTNLKAAIDAAPRAKYVSISQADIATWCNCERCEASEQKYGSNLAIMIKFCNKAAKRVKEDYPDRDLYVHTFSYHETSSAITYIDDEVICEPNVTVMFAPIRANFTAGFKDSTNTSTHASLQAISKVCSHVTLWGYDFNFPQYFLGYNSFTGRQERYATMEENNVAFLFDQGLYNTNNQAAFMNLKIFLTSNLSWDNSLGQESLVNEFFSNYFHAGSTAMKKYFESYRSWTLYAYNELSMSKDINGAGIASSEYWPKGTAKQWLGYIEEAYEDIEYLKLTDPETYQRAYDHITIESLTPRYILIQFYGASYSADELVAMKKAFKEDCYKYNVLRYSEGGTVETLFSDWGI